MLKKLCLFKIIILTLRHNSKVLPYGEEDYYQGAMPGTE